MIEAEQEKKHDHKQKLNRRRVAFLFAFEKLDGYFSRNKYIAQRSEQASLQMERLYPHLFEQRRHGHFPVIGFLPALGTKLRFIRQWKITVRAILGKFVFHVGKIRQLGEFKV
jgi:hypothetical protein